MNFEKRNMLVVVSGLSLHTANGSISITAMQ